MQSCKNNGFPIPGSCIPKCNPYLYILDPSLIAATLCVPAVIQRLKMRPSYKSIS